MRTKEIVLKMLFHGPLSASGNSSTNPGEEVFPSRSRCTPQSVDTQRQGQPRDSSADRV